MSMLGKVEYESASEVQAISKLAFRDLVALIHSTVGLRLREQSAEPIRRWIAEQAAARGISSHGYMALLKAESGEGRDERENLTVRLTTGETYFFRDPALFSLILREILPQIIRARGDQRTLKIWSAGCSTGEEAYTLAMLLNELSAMLTGWDIEILASDINAEALEIARRGVYRDWSFRAMDDQRRDQYFHRSGRHWAIDENLKRNVRFIHQDLHKDRIPNHEIGIEEFDLILCRNVFIYMQPDAVASVAAKLSGALVDGGFLVAGHGELLGHHLSGLRTRVYPEAVMFHKHIAADSAVEYPGLAATGRLNLSPIVPKKRDQSKQPALPLLKIKSVQSSADKSPDFERVMNDAWKSANAGLWDAAWFYCEKASSLQPFDPWPFYLRAQLAHERGNLAQSRTLLERVIYLDHSHIAAYIDLAALLDFEGNAARAGKMRLVACRELKKMDPGANIKPYENSTAAELLAHIENQLESQLAGHFRKAAANRHESVVRNHES